MEVTSYYNVMLIPACSIGLNALTAYFFLWNCNGTAKFIDARTAHKKKGEIQTNGFA
jgi:hypothetical protein